VPFRLRDALNQDLEQLWAIDQACFEPALAYSRTELAFYMARPNAFTLVAASGKDSGQIFGFLVGDRYRGIGHVVTIDILQEARRQGLGTMLMQAAEERFRVARCRAVDLETAVDNQTAIRFYQGLGYSVVGVHPRYYGNGLDALVMRKPLT
jgi:ribosomal-protein-alanine N-acetyltransferase